MTEERLQYLLHQQHIGKGSVEEMAELDLWYNQKDEGVDFTDSLSYRAVGGIEILLWSRIYPETESLETPSFWRVGSWNKIAAVFLGLVVVGLGFYRFNPWIGSTLTEKTAYGEIKTITLPDGSEVVLNGNSEIKFEKDWNEKREVFLKGEAFFKVVHTASHQKFKVQTTDDFSVDVLGTQFFVSYRQKGTKVVLNEGKVQCNMGEEQDKIVVLKPGNMVDFRNDPSGYTLKNVQPERFSSWKDHKLILQNTSLREIGDMLSETYNIQIQVENPSLLSQEVSGSVPMDNVDMLLDGIGAVCHLSVHRTGQNVLLTIPNP